MQRRVMAAFFAGVLVCALAIGAGVGAFYALSDDANAQGESAWGVGTWEYVRFSGDFYPAPLERFENWIAQLPASCDVQTFTAPDGSGSVIVYYRCPDSGGV